MTQTALTYGESLFHLAQEEGKLQEYMAQLQEVSRILQDNSAFLTLLDCRSIPQEERLTALDKSFRGQIEPYILNFMKILCQKGAGSQIPDCIRQFTSLYNDFCGIVEVKAVSAVALSPALKAKLQKKLEEITGKTVVLLTREDPSVLGGLRLDLGGKELDGTVRRRLDEFGKSLSELVL